MRITLTDDNGTEHDVTEAVQIIYDAVHQGMEFGSGMLDTQEIDALRAMSDLAGWEPVEYGLDLCATCGHQRQHHRTYGDGRCYVIGTTLEEHSAPNVRYDYRERMTKEHVLHRLGDKGPCGCSTFVLDRGAGVGWR